MQSNVQGADAKRNTGIDVFRGLLVLAVMLGHFSELTQRHSILTWLGAGFRMPLFIGLTGYMFNLERARSMPLPALLGKYYHRLILPWLVACLVHLTVSRQLDILSPIAIFLRPPYHLWFVPVMMAFILVAAVSRRTPSAMLAIAAPFSIAAMYAFGVGQSGDPILTAPVDRRFFIYPIFFFFGLWVARHETRPWKQRASMLLAMIGLAWWCELHSRPALLPEVAAELILGLSLTSLLPLARTSRLHLPFTASIGRESLYYYLWHPLIFGIWAGMGVVGVPMLLVSLATMVAARPLLARMPGLAGTLGIVGRGGPLRWRWWRPAGAPEAEPAL